MIGYKEKHTYNPCCSSSALDWDVYPTVHTVSGIKSMGIGEQSWGKDCC